MYLKIGQKAHKKMKKPRKTHTFLGLQANSRSKMTKKSLNYVYVMANVESRLELSQLNSSLKLGANVESSEKLIIRVEFLLVS